MNHPSLTIHVAYLKTHNLTNAKSGGVDQHEYRPVLQIIHRVQD
jgi:hypothetical protein